MDRVSLCFHWLMLTCCACWLSCSVDSVDFTGKSCRFGDCPAGYVCQPLTYTCARDSPLLCDSSASDDACQRVSGQDLTCFAATQLGGHDFCAPKCNFGELSTDPAFTCLAPGANVQLCQPVEALKKSVCPTGLACIATDLSTDSGLCMPPCAGDGCKQPIVPCDSTSADDTCAMTGATRPMTCFAASMLHGADYCAEACDPAEPPDDPTHFTCADLGALLRICKPSASNGDDMACPTGFHCYRRDLVLDTGVCIPMPVCTDNSDCPGSTHCTGATLRNLVSNPAILSFLQTDHLNCVFDGCLTLNTTCPPGEECLAKPYFSGGAADLCVPRCDSKGHCPPNYSCATEASGSSTPSLCFPGAPGVRCTDAQGCVAGTCEDTGAGFNVCAVPCASNADCAWLDPPDDSFVCVNGAGHSHCVSPTAFSAPNCNPMVKSDCPADRTCFTYAPFGSLPGHAAECRFPCGPDGRCESFGGLPHVCLAGGIGGCYPAVFGIPCQSECIADLQCLDVPPEDSSMSASGSKICTTPCATDGDCDLVPWTNHQGFCASGFCRRGREGGGACTGNTQCVSRSCNMARGTCN